LSISGDLDYIEDKLHEVFPELAETLPLDDGATILSLELWWLLCKAYVEPRNDSLIERIYGFFRWCVEQTETAPENQRDHFASAVITFLEELPTDPNVRADMPRWFTRRENHDNRHVFTYLIGEDDYLRLLALFPQKPGKAPKPVNERQRLNEYWRSKRLP
jgi:hypothetical protein